LDIYLVKDWKVKYEVIEDHFGFWVDKGTIDTIGLMKIISRRVLDVKDV
jgi:hypothetical protein